MAQTPETVFDHMPCECGSTHLIQTVVQSEDVHVDDDGEINYIDPRDSIDVIELLCPECDETLWERESSEYSIRETDDGHVVLRGLGGNRSINEQELRELLTTDNPVEVR